MNQIYGLKAIVSNTKSPTKSPFVSIIIPVYQQWDRLRLALDALARQTYPHDRFEIIVVNNERDPAFPDWIPALKNLHLLHEPQTGSYAARNAGLKIAKGEIFAFMDSDCIPEPDWIEQAIVAFNEHPEFPRVAGPIEILFTNPEKRTPVELWIGLFAWRQEIAVTEQGSALTGNLFARRQVFEQVGNFNQNLKSGGDTEWGMRANQAGFPIIYAPHVRVSHPARTTWGELTHRVLRLHGASWDKAKNDSVGKQSFWSKLKSFRVGTIMLRTTLTTPKLNSLSDRLKVLLVIVYIGIVRVIEQARLLLGGKTRRA